MRRWNAIVSAAILVLFLVHGIAGAFQMMGIIPGGSAVLKAIAWTLLALIGVHVAIAVKLTVDTIEAVRNSGRYYARENRIFFARRISGFAILLLIFFHVAIFLGEGGEAYRLSVFEGPQLVFSLLLVLSLLVHILTNIRPLLISFGIAGFRIYVKDVLLVLAVVLLVAAAAFVVYYLRWNVLWR